MSSSKSNRPRKFESGWDKLKKKRRIDALVQFQKGAIDRFVTKSTQVSSDNPSPTPDHGQAVDNNIDSDSVNPSKNNVEVEEALPGSTNTNSDDLNPSLDASDSFQPDIFDPRYWDSLDRQQVDILAQKGPKRDLLIQKGPKDRFSRRFSALFYTRFLSNGEGCDRDWLVYSKELDRILKDNITELTVKSVSATRWESRIDSVKAIRFQCADIREALLQVSDINNDPGKSSEAKETLKTLDDQDLKSSCDNLEAALKKDGKSDIDAKELYMELKFLREFIPEERMGPIEILWFLKDHGCFPNATIAYRVLLTIPVTVASADRSFSKLKLLKTYLRSTMTQERLNDLAIIALEDPNNSKGEICSISRRSPLSLVRSSSRSREDFRTSIFTIILYHLFSLPPSSGKSPSSRQALSALFQQVLPSVIGRFQRPSSSTRPLFSGRYPSSMSCVQVPGPCWSCRYCTFLPTRREKPSSLGPVIPVRAPSPFSKFFSRTVPRPEFSYV
ncbi:hAT family dimerisation domain [Striga hermonthica]|uniref:HAT family dimerisation domain n=1 Tax=Striga hermonthica TaxID=68872 RepID=A0A9N7NEB1_STRHE|nr:hAT family dimerisation domain [Striga hermonthica]